MQCKKLYCLACVKQRKLDKERDEKSHDKIETKLEVERLIL